MFIYGSRIWNGTIWYQDHTIQPGPACGYGGPRNIYKMHNFDQIASRCDLLKLVQQWRLMLNILKESKKISFEMEANGACSLLMIIFNTNANLMQVSKLIIRDMAKAYLH